MVSDIENDTREMSTGKNSIEKRVDVVIVNWNAGALLRECVDSVIRYGQPLVDQIIVVDNGSTDGSESAVEGLPGTHLIRAHENLGFARACNRRGQPSHSGVPAVPESGRSASAGYG